MPGPRPKNPATRRRSNRVSTAATLPAEQPAAAPPDLPAAAPPDLPDERDWHPQTKSLWADVFTSPMAGEFLRSDIHGLVRLAVWVDDYWRADSAMTRKALAQEIRLQGQAFGLSPIGRRRLQWEVGRVEDRKGDYQAVADARAADLGLDAGHP
jgi:hypothetical protein